MYGVGKFFNDPIFFAESQHIRLPIVIQLSVDCWQYPDRGFTPGAYLLHGLSQSRELLENRKSLDPQGEQPLNKKVLNGLRELLYQNILSSGVTKMKGPLCRC